MQSNTLMIRCATSASVVLRATYELVANGAMVETTTQQDGSPVSRIIFLKVSHD